MINDSFECENCNQLIPKHPEWSARNHCPFCLCSKHVDDTLPWDRMSECHSLMRPVGIDYRKNKWYMIKHKCSKCDKEILNKVAPDDKFEDFTKTLYKNERFL